MLKFKPKIFKKFNRKINANNFRFDNNHHERIRKFLIPYWNSQRIKWPYLNSLTSIHSWFLKKKNSLLYKHPIYNFSKIICYFNSRKEMLFNTIKDIQFKFIFFKIEDRFIHILKKIHLKFIFFKKKIKHLYNIFSDKISHIFAIIYIPIYFFLKNPHPFFGIMFVWPLKYTIYSFYKFCNFFFKIFKKLKIKKKFLKFFLYPLFGEFFVPSKASKVFSIWSFIKCFLAFFLFYITTPLPIIILLFVVVLNTLSLFYNDIWVVNFFKNEFRKFKKILKFFFKFFNFKFLKRYFLYKKTYKSKLIRWYVFNLFKFGKIHTKHYELTQKHFKLRTRLNKRHTFYILSVSCRKQPWSGNHINDFYTKHHIFYLLYNKYGCDIQRWFIKIFLYNRSNKFYYNMWNQKLMRCFLINIHFTELRQAYSKSLPTFYLSKFGSSIFFRKLGYRKKGMKKNRRDYVNRRDRHGIFLIIFKQVFLWNSFFDKPSRLFRIEKSLRHTNLNSLEKIRLRSRLFNIFAFMYAFRLPHAGLIYFISKAHSRKSQYFYWSSFNLQASYDAFFEYNRFRYKTKLVDRYNIFFRRMDYWSGGDSKYEPMFYYNYRYTSFFKTHVPWFWTRSRVRHDWNYEKMMHVMGKWHMSTRNKVPKSTVSYFFRNQFLTSSRYYTHPRFEWFVYTNRDLYGIDFYQNSFFFFNENPDYLDFIYFFI